MTKATFILIHLKIGQQSSGGINVFLKLSSHMEKS